MAREISLDGIVLSSGAVAAWHEIAMQVAVTLQNIGRGRILSIPDERACVNDDGTLTIFVNIPGVIDVSMDVHVGQWGVLSIIYIRF